MSSQTVERAEAADLERRWDGLLQEADKISKFERPTAAQSARMAAIADEIIVVQTRLSAIERAEQVAAVRAAAKSGHVEGPSGSPEVRPDESRATGHPYGGSVRDAALRTIERYTQSGHLRPDAASTLDHVVRSGGDTQGPDPTGEGAAYLAAVGNPHYNSAFGKLVADPTTGHLRFSPEESEAVRVVGQVQAMRALGTGSGAIGGFAIPFTLDPSIILTSSGALNPWRGVSRVITVATKEWRGVSSDGVTAAYVAEAAESTDSSPVLAQPTIVTQQGRAFVPFSIEVSQDWVGIQDELMRLIADARDVLDATKFLTGTGTNEPAGILTGLTTTQRVQTNTVATYAVGDPWLLKAAIPARFIPNTVFAANPATYDLTYRFVGGNSAEPLQFDAGRSGSFLGRPKVEASPMFATVNTTPATGSKLIIAGDFRTAFTVVDRIGLTCELIPHIFGPTNRFPTGQRGLFAYWRSGSAVVAPNALRYLESK